MRAAAPLRSWRRRSRRAPWSARSGRARSGSASPMPCSASPMPATLPWPKIAQTPSMKRSPSSVICTLEPAHHRLRRGQPDRLAHAAASFVHATPPARRPRLVPEAAEPRVAPRHLGDRRVVGDLARQPAARRLAEDRAADGEALDQVEAGGGREARGELGLRRVEAEHHDAAGVAGRCARSRRWRSPRRRARSSARASTSRARRRRRRTAGSASRWCRRRPAPTLEGMISSRNSSRLRREASQSRLTVASCSARISGVSSGWQKQSTLTTSSRAHSASAAVVAARARARASAAASPAIRTGRPIQRPVPAAACSAARPSRLSQRMP